MKAVDADSDEQAARFSTPTSLIDSRGDLLLLVAWKWHLIVGKEGRPLGEYPHIFASTILPAGDIAQERDVRLEITGGKIVDGEVLVPSSKNEGFVADPGNYGKFWRLVHESRREAPDLSPSVRKLLAFMEKVELQAPRNRMAFSRRKGR